MPAPAVAPAIPVAFTMGNALTGLGTGLALAGGTHFTQRIYGYLMSDGNGGSVFVPEVPGSVGNGIPGLQVMDPIVSNPPKKRRKRSKYQMEFGRSMKALKRKHPRTPTNRLMKRAHTMTKKKMKTRRR